MLLIMLISAVQNTVRLYRQEPIPTGKPVPGKQPLILAKKFALPGGKGAQ
jgi:hypothetical protein